MLKYADTIKDNESTSYAVQTNFPGVKDSDFGSYSRFAYTHKDNPGERNFIVFRHPEIFQAAENRGGGDTSLHFATPEAAYKAAMFLRENGRLTSGWAGPEEWRGKYRGQLKVRVVEIYSKRVEKIVDFNP